MTTPDISEAEARFWGKVLKTSSCWVWQGSTNECGYGEFWLSPRVVRAHRFSWLLHHGDPAGAHVLHTCDNPACVNPEHLFLGTHTDNMKDMTRKGRGKPMRGDAHTSAKLNRAKVADIRRRIAAGEVQRRLAEEYGVRNDIINRIHKGKIWKL